MHSQDHLAFLLHSCPGLGAGTLVSMLRCFGSPEAVVAADTAALAALGCPPEALRWPPPPKDAAIF